MTIKCVSCGANITEHDETCSFCGTKNAGYTPIDDDVNSLLERAKKTFDNELYAESISYYKQAIALDPNIFNAYFHLAAGYANIKRYEEAIKAMEQANELRPGLVPVYYNLGMLNKLHGRKDEARKYYEMALAQIKKEPSDNKQLQKSIEKELEALGVKKRWKLF